MPPESDRLPVVRTRIATALLSLAVIGMELALMRSLSLRFWHHLAHMVISVALLGFGAAGTAIALAGRGLLRRRRGWISGLSIACALSILLTGLAGRAVPLNVQFLAWDLRQIAHVLSMELLMLIPFLAAGAAVGLVLTDEANRLGGHYAANLAGSGAGAIAAVALMYVLSTWQLQVAMAAAAMAAGLVLLRLKPGGFAAAAGAVAAMLLICLTSPQQPLISQYKMLAYLRSMPDTRTIHQASSPLGRIDVVAGPAIHYSPGVSLQYTDPIPPHVLMIHDADQTAAVYNCRDRRDWRFMDYTTGAAAYRVGPAARVLVIGAGGGAELGLAQYHGCADVLGLELDRKVIDAMRGPLAEIGGGIYDYPSVRILAAEARGYLAASDEKFDLIQFPALDAFGASGAGLHATAESYLYTVEAAEAMLDHLSDRGVLSLTRWAKTPPRDGLRIFDTLARALRREGLEPAGRLAMIRSWATVTVLAARSPLSTEQNQALRDFCAERSFDICYLPDIKSDEPNRHHVLDRPYYFEGAAALLGPTRRAYLDEYLFDIAAATDDRPYFYRFFRLRSLPVIAEQLAGRSRAFVEIGHLMLIAALAQAVILAAVLIVLPLAPGIGSLGAAPAKAATFGYFLLLGAGFMLLEMGFLQRLILYLADPIYSAAVVIGSFLIFAGAGSVASGRWARPRSAAVAAGAAVVCITGVYLAGMDRWLAASAGAGIGARMAIAAATIAPPAFAMGHMLPAGLRLIRQSAPPMVPWAWAVNGFASVVATVSAPLIAMQIGFAHLILLAGSCYALAAAVALRLPRPAASDD